MSTYKHTRQEWAVARQIDPEAFKAVNRILNRSSEAVYWQNRRIKALNSARHRLAWLAEPNEKKSFSDLSNTFQDFPDEMYPPPGTYSATIEEVSLDNDGQSLSYTFKINDKPKQEFKMSYADGVHTVVCTFESSPSRQYHYLTRDGTIDPGDYVNVQTSIKSWPSICKVKEILYNTRSHHANKFIIGKVDFKAYETARRLEEEEKARRESLRVELAMHIEGRQNLKRQVHDQIIKERLEADPTYRATEARIKELQAALGS